MKGLQQQSESGQQPGIVSPLRPTSHCLCACFLKDHWAPWCCICPSPNRTYNHTGTRMSSCRHFEHATHSHALDTQACTVATHTPLSCVCCKHVEARAHTHAQGSMHETHMDMVSFSPTWRWLHTNTHTHTTACVDPQRPATHIQMHGLRPTGMR